MPESYVTNHTEKGDISISEDVVALMVSAAISEIEGVSGLSNPTSTDLAERFGLKNAARVFSTPTPLIILDTTASSFRLTMRVFQWRKWYERDVFKGDADR